MLRFFPRFFPSALTFTPLSTFSRISKSDMVPKILKDPKFTRTGISTKKKKSYQHNLKQPHIVNPQLYYNERFDKRRIRKEYKLRRALRNPYPSITNETLTENLLNNLNDEFLLSRASGRILNVVLELEKRDMKLVEKYNALIKRALVKVSEKAVFYNFREFGMLVTLSARYLPENKDVWRDFALIYQGILEKKKYYKEEIIGNKNKEMNFVFIFNNIYKASTKHRIDISEIRAMLSQLALDKADKLSSFSQFIVFVTTLCNNSKAECQALLSRFLPKIKENLDKINAKDALALIRTLQKSEMPLDSSLLNQLENKVMSELKEEKEPGNDHLKQFAMLCQSVSHIRNHKSTVFPEFATKYFQQYKNKITGTLELAFLADAFSKMKIHVRDIYKYIEKHLNNRISALPLPICEQLLASASRRYENYSLVFLSFLAARLDQIYSNPALLQGLNASRALLIINLMNIVQQKDRSCKFENYEAFISVVDRENEKQVELQKNAENGEKKKNKEGKIK